MHTHNLIREFLRIVIDTPVNASHYGKRRLHALQKQFTEVEKICRPLWRGGQLCRGSENYFFMVARVVSKISLWLIREGTLDPFSSFTFGRFLPPQGRRRRRTVPVRASEQASLLGRRLEPEGSDWS
jgi:hypothetical protein